MTVCDGEFLTLVPSYMLYVFVCLAFIVGFPHGWITRKIAYCGRVGVYVKHDDKRIGAYTISVVLVLNVIAQVRSLVFFGHPAVFGWWPFVWSVAYCWGITAGYALERTRGNGVLPPLVKYPDE